MQCLIREPNSMECLWSEESFVCGEPAQQASVKRHLRQQTGHHIGQHIHATHQVELLKDDADVRAQLADVRAQVS
jgi:hypothetical protein